MPGVQVLAVVLDADRVELGPEYGGVGDGQQVGSLGFDRPVEGADPGLVGGGRRVLEVLSDGDHGYEPAGAGGDHLGAVVRGGQQQRSQIIIAVQDQLTLKGVSAFQGGGEQVLGLQGLQGGEADLDVGLLGADGRG